MAITRSVAFVVVAGVLAAGCGGSPPAEVAAPATPAASTTPAPAPESPQPSEAATFSEDAYWSVARLDALEAGKKAFVRPVAEAEAQPASASTQAPAPAPVADPTPATQPAPISAPAATPTATPSTPDEKKKLLEGRVLLSTVEADSSCETPDVRAPEYLKVLAGSDGDVIAKIELDDGKTEPAGLSSFVCVYPFEVKLPDEPVFAFEVDDRDPVVVSSEELALREWKLEIIVWQ